MTDEAALSDRTATDRTTGADRLRALEASPGPRGVAVVTGGSAGLGRAIVRAFAAADRVERELGPIEVWVNDAMVGVFAEFLRVAPEDFERATAVTYLGFVNGTRAALRRMTERDRGVVVQVGSALSFRGIPLQAAYCGAKHAMVGFTESVITELLHDRSRVRVCMVHMPALDTVQFNWVRNDLPLHPQPVPPIYQPEVGARAVLHAALHPRFTTWVGLPTAATIIGNRLVAPLLDRYLARTGYSGQQTAGDHRQAIGDNLYTPVAGDHGAHGDFDARAHSRSPELALSLHKRGVLAGVLGAAGVGAVLAGRR